MGITLFMLLVAGLLPLWAFWKFQPDAPDKARQIKVFNQMILGVCVLFWFVWGLVVSNYIGTQAERVIPILVMAGFAGINIVFLGVFTLLRNFWLFKPASHNPNRILRK
ncbi:MAG: hypothetical protein OXT65_02585 [Alphaproteobacteria bacterium]|nr:hypothetical protein [Alphaproteobacteria bacterium]